MDEASTGLDPRARMELWDTANSATAKAITILLTSDILDETDRCDHPCSGTTATSWPRVPRLNSKPKSAATSSFWMLPIPTIWSAALAFASGSMPRRGWQGARRNRQRPPLHRRSGRGFPGEIESVALHKPTLEDVFVHETAASHTPELLVAWRHALEM